VPHAQGDSRSPRISFLVEEKMSTSTCSSIFLSVC
jgi:hypothetical protein